MRSDRRLDGLEAAMTAKQAARYWLEERLTFDSPSEYHDWLSDQPLGLSDLDRVMARAKTAARKASRGERRSLVAGAEQRAVRDALFLVQLVLVLEAAATDLIRTELLRSEKLIWQLRALNAEWTLGLASAAEDELPGLAARWHGWPEAMREHLLVLYVEEESRAILERRYLDGDVSVFRETLDRLDGLRATAEATTSCWTELRAPSLQAAAAVSIEMPALPTLDFDALRLSARTQAEARAAELVDEACVATLSILGDFRAAMKIVDSHSSAAHLDASAE